MKTGQAKKDGHPLETKPSPEGVISFLTEGNRRFFEDRCRHPRSGAVRRLKAHRSDQAHHAMATVLACSDSRLPVERVFDAGIMDLFVVRVAGNVVSPEVAASLEYGALHVHTPLVVVLGHTGCGAVTATWRHLAKGGPGEPGTINNLLSLIEPVFERVGGKEDLTEPEIVNRGAEENVWQAISDLGRMSPGIVQACRDGGIGVVGAMYDLETGRVIWLDRKRADEALEGRI